MEDAVVPASEESWFAAVRAQALARMQRPPPRVPRVMHITVLATLLALHGAIFLVWYASRFPLGQKAATVVQVRLIEESAAPMPSLPQPVRKEASARAQPSPPRQSMAAELKTEASSPTASPPPLLFNRDGTVHLPPPAPTPWEEGLARGRELLARGHNIIHCRRSRFDDGLTPAQAAAAAASSAHMAHLIMGNPLDPLNDVGQRQTEDAAGEHAAEKRRIEEQACDG